MKRVAVGGDRQRVVARSLVSESRLRGDSGDVRWRRWQPRWRVARAWAGASETAVRSVAGCTTTWWSELHRADTDDDLLRFFTVVETAGMLG
jgi:hypothetical protein